MESCAIETEFSLKIENISLSDGGHYTCKFPLDNVESESVHIQSIGG